MYRTNDKSLWRVFRPHHYLSAELNDASICYSIYWGETLVGFLACLSFPSGVVKYAWRVSRLVILPDYQNLNFGTAILEFLGDKYLTNGTKYFIRSSHLRLKSYWSHSNKWVETSSSGKVSKRPKNPLEIQFGKRDTELNRIAYSFEYMGNDYAEKPHLMIYVDDTDEIDYSILEKDLLKLKNIYWLCVITGEINTESEIEKICLKNGIRTELMYHTVKKQITKKSDAINHKVITIWNNELSEYIENNVDEFSHEIIPGKFIDKNIVSKVMLTQKQYSIKKQELW